MLFDETVLMLFDETVLMLFDETVDIGQGGAQVPK